jgi:hypothetical protein
MPEQDIILAFGSLHNVLLKPSGLLFRVGGDDDQVGLERVRPAFPLLWSDG